MHTGARFVLSRAVNNQVHCSQKGQATPMHFSCPKVFCLHFLPSYETKENKNWAAFVFSELRPLSRFPDIMALPLRCTFMSFLLSKLRGCGVAWTKVVFSLLPKCGAWVEAMYLAERATARSNSILQHKQTKRCQTRKKAQNYGWLLGLFISHHGTEATLFCWKQENRLVCCG